MANYKEIKGLTVQNLSTDPTLNTEGQVWFNSSSGKLKSLVQIAGWSSSSAMNTGRKGGDFSFGTQTAAVKFPPVAHAPPVLTLNDTLYSSVYALMGTGSPPATKAAEVVVPAE